MFEVLISEFTGGVLDVAEVFRITLRLVTAVLLGAVIGYQRESAGKDAGLRTHMLVALGAALFVLAPHGAEMTVADTSRVIQGVITGVGFLGAGAILKRSSEQVVHGLTTAAGIWLTAAIGVAAGLGQLAVATLTAVLAAVILACSRGAERQRAKRHPEGRGAETPPPAADADQAD